MLCMFLLLDFNRLVFLVERVNQVLNVNTSIQTYNFQQKIAAFSH